MRASRVVKRGSCASSGRAIAISRPSQNFGCDERWIASSFPSLQRNANECELATRVSGSLRIPHLGVVGEWVRDECDRRLEHVDLDAAAAARALALVERAEDAVTGKHAGGVIGDGRAADLRMLGVEQEARDAAERKPHAVIGRPAAVRPRGAKAGDGAVDELWVRCGERVGARARAAP